MKTRLFFLLLLLPLVSIAQIITTVAGGGSGGGVGDGGPASSARIENPGGMVFSKTGELYIASGGSHRIRKIDTCGIITTIAGNGTPGYTGDGAEATAALINYPIGIALDTVGNIYFSEFRNHIIRRIDHSTGIISTIGGNGAAGYSGDNGVATVAQLDCPQSICMDNSGSVFISENNHVIRKIDAAGIITTIAGTHVAGYNGDGIPATAAKLNFPQDVTTDSRGNVYVCDQGNSRVRKINPAGFISTIAGNGAYTYIGDGIPATNAQFFPNFIRFDSTGNLFIAGGQRCFKVDTFGIFHTIVGNGTMSTTGDGGPATAATIDHAVGVALDRCANPYFSTIVTNTIHKITYDTGCKYCSTPTLGSAVVSSSSTMQIFPNPFREAFTVTSPKVLNSVQLCNAMGQAIYNEQYFSTAATINTAGLPVGLYFVYLTYADGTKAVQKVVKE